MKTAIVCVTNDLATDQRVHKTCLTLQKCGYNVITRGRLLHDSLPLERSYKTKRVKHFFNKGVLFYAEYNIRLFFYLLFRKFDILISNDTDTLVASFLTSKIKRTPLIFDAHELFPEVPELENRPFVKKTWRKIEDIFFPKLKNAFTVCSSIASYYNNRYRIQMRVVRNITNYQSVNTTKKNSKHKTIIYQGALNIGRGLEWIIAAMPKVNANFIIVGDGDIKNELIKLVKDLGLEEKVFFLGKIPPDELRSISNNADLGMCLLENKGLSYYFSLPNIIFDYIHAGIPILATDFPEIHNIVNKYNTGILINKYEPEYLAETINKILANEFDTTHFADLKQELCWKNEEKILIEIINNASKK